MPEDPTTEDPMAATIETDTAFDALVRRLSRQSVERHFDAFADVDWDAEALQIDPGGARWAAVTLDPLTDTGWYRRQPPEIQARIGLHRIATAMRTGWEFENVLQRGLLAYAFWLPNHRPEFRYLHHEVAEESHHTMMFQEFVDRCGLPVDGLPARMKVTAELLVAPFARIFPPLFFMFVLGGEDPIDYVQRQRLRAGIAHPLVERIVRIHVTEEARHLSFARHYLKRRVPQLSRFRRAELAVGAPLILAAMAQMMLRPSRQIVADYAIPASVLDLAYTYNPEHRAATVESLQKVRRLCEEVGLLTPAYRRLWRVLGLGSGT
ncbi:MAG TPA: diiron oxygenase [Acidimicrobiales bacterium]|nr:diiron oxygenase [Acidimicrobiales bacterium]